MTTNRRGQRNIITSLIPINSIEKIWTVNVIDDDDEMTCYTSGYHASTRVTGLVALHSPRLAHSLNLQLCRPLAVAPATEQFPDHCETGHRHVSTPSY